MKKKTLHNCKHVSEDGYCKPQQRHSSVLDCFQIDKLQVYNLPFWQAIFKNKILCRVLCQPHNPINKM